MMERQDNWQWQEYGTAWHGIGIYHVTLTIPSREPLLGTLVIPDNDRAVMAAYGFSAKMSESECVAELFKMYQNLTK